MTRGYKSFRKIKLNDKNDYIKIYKNGGTNILKSITPEGADEYFNHRTFIIYKDSKDVYFLRKHVYTYEFEAPDTRGHSTYYSEGIPRAINNARKENTMYTNLIVLGNYVNGI